MVATAAAAGCHHCTATFTKLARRAGVTKEQMVEAVLTARFALASTTIATAIESMEYRVQDEENHVGDTDSA